MDKSTLKRIEHNPWIFKTKLPHCQIWEHIVIHSIAEVYCIDHYQQSFIKINRNKPHLVNALGIVTDHRNLKTYLLIQRIPNRLSEVGTLNQSQTLKVLYAVFKGLQQLEQIYGHVKLTQSCICFNEQGKVKIWVNYDLSSIHPMLIIKQMNDNKFIEILYETIKMIQNKCFNKNLLKNLYKKIKDNQILTYQDISEQIVKIGELLFFDIQQKLINQQYNNTIYGDKNKCYQSSHLSNIFKKQNTTNNHIKKKFIKNQSDLSQNPFNFSYHSRNLSNNDINHNSFYKKYQPFIQKNKKNYQPLKSRNFNISLNGFHQGKFAENQVHKSAPLSPRQQQPIVTVNNNNKTSQQPKDFHKKTNEQQHSQQKRQVPSKLRLNVKKQFYFNKKQSDKHTSCSTIKQDVDDSFSKNLKIDDKQITMSGQFQTFGILDDLNNNNNGNNNSNTKNSNNNDSNNNSTNNSTINNNNTNNNNNNSNNNSNSNCNCNNIRNNNNNNANSIPSNIKNNNTNSKRSSNQRNFEKIKTSNQQIITNRSQEFNVHEMDLQIQRKLSKKTKQNQDKGKAIYIQQQKQPIKNQIQHKTIKPYNNKLYSQTMSFDRKVVPQPKIQSKPKNKMFMESGKIKRQQSPSVIYIDNKYQQYVNNKISDNSSNVPLLHSRGHSKHVSSYENFSILNNNHHNYNANSKKIKQFLNHTNSNKSLQNNLTNSISFRPSDHRFTTKQ